MVQPSQPTPKKKSVQDREEGLAGAFKGAQIGGPKPYGKKGANTGGRIGTNTNLPTATKRSNPQIGRRIESIPRPKPPVTNKKGQR
jgi:hypothetical protein